MKRMNFLQLSQKVLDIPLTDIFNMPHDQRKEITSKLEKPVKNLYELINYLSNSSIEGENPLIVSRTVKYLLSFSKKNFHQSH